jgi:hypothetical protein
MNTNEFWALVDDARRDGGGADAVAARAAAALATRDAADIVACDRHIRRVLAASQRADLWGAAYLVNGGCSDDGFDHFRGWLMTQGREAFARAVAEPDSLADLPVVRRAATTGEEFGCAAMLAIGHEAHLKKTGTELPPDPTPVVRPDTDDFWDFDDEEEVARRFPRLAAHFSQAPAE